MVVRKQHLFLFFEENEFEFDISSNLVRLSMNRFIVDEEAQFEIIGAYNLKKLQRKMLDKPGLKQHPDYKKFAKERTEKEAFDEDLISEAMNKALLNQSTSTDAHFIIENLGLDSSTQFSSDTNKRITRLYHWMLFEMQDIGLQSLYCTFYHGTRQFLMTKEGSVACYRNQIFRDMTGKNDKIFSFQPKSSILDDLEDFLQHIKDGCRPSMILWQNPLMLFLNKMLTKKETYQAINRDNQFWNTLLNNSPGITIRSHQDPSLHRNHQSPNNEDKFVYCFCWRFTILLK